MRKAACSIAAGLAVILLAAALFVAVAPARAAMLLRDQILQSDTVWEGTVEITGVVVVGRRATLTIRPGTVVRFRRIDRNRDGFGDGELRVLGRLLARGTAGAPIVFTSAAAEPRPLDWSYVLIFTSGKRNIIDHCRFQYAFSGLQVHFSTASVTNSRFVHNREGMRFGRAHLDISGNTFSDNSTGVRFTRMEGPVTFSGNRVTGNRIGIFLAPSGQNIRDFFEPDRSGRPWNTGRLTITGNDIFENIWYNFDLGEKQIWDLDARNNWWGTTDTAIIRQKIYDKHRDQTLGRVVFTPFATAPFSSR